jgi:hypothetical protein
MERQSVTGKLVIFTKDQKHDYFVTLGYYEDGRLGEVFVCEQREGSTVGALLDALSVSVSVGLQYGIPWEVFEVKFAHQVFEPRGMTDSPDPELKIVSSPLDYLARWISKRTTLEKADEERRKATKSFQEALK